MKFGASMITIMKTNKHILITKSKKRRPNDNSPNHDKELVIHDEGLVHSYLHE